MRVYYLRVVIHHIICIVREEALYSFLSSQLMLTRCYDTIHNHM